MTPFLKRCPRSIFKNDAKTARKVVRKMAKTSSVLKLKKAKVKSAKYIIV